MILLNIFLIPTTYLLMRSLYHFFAQVRLRQQGRVQLVAHVVRQYKNFCHFANFRYFLLHWLDVAAKLLQMCLKKEFAVFEKRFAKRRYELIVNSTLFANLIAHVIKVCFSEHFELAVLHLKKVAYATIYARIVVQLVCLQLDLQHDFLIAMFHWLFNI